MVFDELIVCLRICGSIRSQIPPATTVGEAWAVFLIPPICWNLCWYSGCSHPLRNHLYWAQSSRHMEASTQLWDRSTTMGVCASGRAFACARVSAAAFSHAHASLCAWWVGLLHGFWTLANHWDCSGTVCFPTIQESIHVRVQGSRQPLPELHQGTFLLLGMQHYYWPSHQPGRCSGVCTVLSGKGWG